MTHIQSIEVWHKDLEFKEPYWLAGGRLKFEVLDSTIVRVICSDGTIGWGESCPWGHTYIPGFGPGARAAMPFLADVLLGEDPLHIDYLNQKMDIQLPGHLYAKSALDIALWDIKAKRLNVPLFVALGGAFGEDVLVNSSIST
ncbi:MAG: mandelate racemase, partial [Pseudomonadota bacterium]